MTQQGKKEFIYAAPGQSFETDVVVIGAGPVGLFSLFECGMMNMKCHVVDALDMVGGQCAALYPEKPIYDIPAWPVIKGGELINKLEEQAAPFNPVFHLKQQVTAIEKDESTGIFTTQTSVGTRIRSKAIFIAAGVGAFGPNRPPLAGLRDYEGKPEGTGVAYLVRNPDAFAGKNVVIAGGGDSAVDWANALGDKAKKIYVVHRRAKFRAAPESVRKMESLVEQGKLELVTPYQLSALEGEGGVLQGVRVATLEGQSRLLPCDSLLAFFGLSMNLGPIAQWGLGFENNHIKVNGETQETSAPGIFAIGDIATYPGKQKLILTGFAESALAAHQAFNIVFPGQVYHFEYSTTKGAPGHGPV